MRASVERVLEGILALKLCLKNISHLRHPKEAAVGTVVGHYRNWDQRFCVGSPNFLPEFLEVAIEVAQLSRLAGFIIELVGRAVTDVICPLHERLLTQWCLRRKVTECVVRARLGANLNKLSASGYRILSIQRYVDIRWAQVNPLRCPLALTAPTIRGDDVIERDGN